MKQEGGRSDSTRLILTTMELSALKNAESTEVFHPFSLIFFFGSNLVFKILIFLQFLAPRRQ